MTRLVLHRPLLFFFFYETILENTLDEIYLNKSNSVFCKTHTGQKITLKKIILSQKASDNYCPNPPAHLCTALPVHREREHVQSTFRQRNWGQGIGRCGDLLSHLPPGGCVRVTDESGPAWPREGAGASRLRSFNSADGL